MSMIAIKNELDQVYLLVKDLNTKLKQLAFILADNCCEDTRATHLAVAHETQGLAVTSLVAKDIRDAVLNPNFGLAALSASTANLAQSFYSTQIQLDLVKTQTDKVGDQNKGLFMFYDKFVEKAAALKESIDSVVSIDTSSFGNAINVPAGATAIITDTLASSNPSDFLTKQGAGKLVLVANNTYVGVTNNLEGTLEFSSQQNTGINNSIFNTGIINLKTISDITFSKILAGTGKLQVEASQGAVTIVSSNTYAGGTDLNSGTTIVGNNSAFGTGTVTVKPGATLNLNGYVIPNNLIVNGGTVLFGSMVQSGQTNVLGGTITLNGGSLNTQNIGTTTYNGINGTQSTGTISLNGQQSNFSFNLNQNGGTII